MTLKPKGYLLLMKSLADNAGASKRLHFTYLDDVTLYTAR